jgi:hypothetical protein
MADSIVVEGLTFEFHGISGRVQDWENRAGVTTDPCHDPEFFVIDDHTFIDGQSARQPPPGSGLTERGVNYRPPIDCRSLFFDDGNSRTHGIDGACIDLIDVQIPAGKRLDFTWKFLSADGEATGPNDFALMLAYDGPAPAPAPAPTIDAIRDGSAPAPINLMQGATVIHDPSMSPRLAEGRDLRTNSIHNTHWMRGPSWRPGGAFRGTVRWIACNGWRLHGGDQPSTTNRNSLRRQRASPPSLFLDCVHII